MNERYLSMIFDTKIRKSTKTIHKNNLKDYRRGIALLKMVSLFQNKLGQLISG